MKVKKGDTVIVITGKDKGKSGTITKVLPRENRVIVEGINVYKKHKKPTRSGSSGQIVEKAMPIHASNVMIADPKTGKPTRISIERKEGKRIRIARKSGSPLS